MIASSFEGALQISTYCMNYQYRRERTVLPVRDELYVRSSQFQVTELEFYVYIPFNCDPLSPNTLVDTGRIFNRKNARKYDFSSVIFIEYTIIQP